MGEPYKRPKKLRIHDEECVCHGREIKETSKGVADAEVRIIVYTEDGRAFETVIEVELYEQN